MRTEHIDTWVRAYLDDETSADQYWSVSGHPEAAKVAWSYSAPLPAVGKAAGLVAFYDELGGTSRRLAWADKCRRPRRRPLRNRPST